VAAVLLASAAGGSSAQGSCRFEAATALSFEAYNPRIAEPTIGTGTILLSCSEPTTVMIAIGPGSSGDSMHRAMVSPAGARLAYNLYTDPRYAEVWGDGSAAPGPTVSVPGGYRTTRVTVFGAIAPHQSVASGSYGDDPFVTIEF
jgi:spore coat protein U-like protein